METDPTADPLTIPPALVAQVRAVAEEEHRSAGDVVGEALERYLHARRWQKVFAYGEQQARELGLSEADIPRLMAEYREQHSKAEQ